MGLSYSKRHAKQGVDQEFGHVGSVLSSREKCMIDTHCKECHMRVCILCMCEEFTMMMNFKLQGQAYVSHGLIVIFPFFVPLLHFYTLHSLCSLHTKYLSFRCGPVIHHHLTGRAHLVLERGCNLLHWIG